MIYSKTSETPLIQKALAHPFPTIQRCTRHDTFHNYISFIFNPIPLLLFYIISSFTQLNTFSINFEKHPYKNHITPITILNQISIPQHTYNTYTSK
jgi:hypothetical protein